MHYVIHCLDYPGAVQKRLAHYDATRPTSPPPR